MSLFYDMILEMKLSLTDDNVVEIVTPTPNGDTTIRKNDKICCVDGMMIINRKNGNKCIIDLEYIVKVYTRRKDL